MKNHVLRPLWVAIVAVILILVVRYRMVPDDFGVHGDSFTYNFYRKSAVDDWKNSWVTVKYQGKEYCRECHEEKVEENLSGAHAIIQCENCHGPALDHPDDPEHLEIPTGRLLCLRCHAALPYPTSQRADIPGIEPNIHNVDEDCFDCHNPHNPDLENM